MNRLFLFLAILCTSLAWGGSNDLTQDEKAFTQKIGLDPDEATPEQIAKARSMLKGRDPSTLSDEEVQIAKQAVADAKAEGKLGSSQKSQSSTDSVAPPPSPVKKQQAPDTTEERFVPPPKQGLRRCEVDFFARALPSAFYDLQTAVAPDYPIKPGDNLVLTLWGTVEKEFHLIVNNQGQVNIEGVGLVSLNNMNLGEAQSFLRAKLKAAYAGIRTGGVSVNLRPESISATKIFVMGEVVQPGGYDMPGNSNVFLALYRARGPTEIGSTRHIRITHADGEKEEVDLYDLLFKGVKPSRAILKDGDVVFLPRAGALVSIDGDIGHPAIYELKENEGIKDLFEFAGQPNPTAAHTVSLARFTQDGHREITDLESPSVYRNGKAFPLLDGDSLNVRTSTEYSRSQIEVVGSVWYPGQYQLTPGESAADAVQQAGGARPEAKTNRVLIRRLLKDSSFTYLADAIDSSKLSIPLQERDQVIVLNETEMKTANIVSIAGAVKKPLSLTWQKDLTVQNLVALAGGFTRDHLKGRVRIAHLVPGKKEVRMEDVEIRDDLSIGTDEVKLQPGDRLVVYVDPDFYEQEVVKLSGAFLSPGSYSLLRKRETFKELMDRVGALDKNAFPEGGRLFRRRGDGVYQINFSIDKALKGKDGASVALQGGDSVYIPLELVTVQVTGEVVSPGDVLWHEGMDISDYLDAAGGLTFNGDEDRVIVTYANGKKATMKRADLDPDPGSIIYVPYQKKEPADWYKVWGTVAAIISAFAQTAIALIAATK